MGLKDASEHELDELDIRDVLVHLFYETHYAGRINRVWKAFADYFAAQSGGSATVFLYNPSSACYGFHVSSNHDLARRLESVSFTKETLQNLLQGEAFARLKNGDGVVPDGVIGEAHAGYLWPLSGRGGSALGVFILIAPAERWSKKALDRVTRIIDECGKMLFQVEKLINAANAGKRYRHLFDVTRKVHSTMDEQEILDEVLRSLNTLYPDFQIRLLSMEDVLAASLESQAASEAFLSGKVRFERSETHARMYAPLSGRQGVYGVLEMTAPDTGPFPDDESEFIALLASTAGHAFENARLYQQSQQSISDLRLLNRTSQRLNANLRFEDTVDYLIGQMLKDFNADEAGFLLVKNDGEPEVYPKSTPYFHTEDGRTLVQSIAQQLKAKDEPVFLGDMQRETWGRNSAYRSFIAIPMHLDEALFGAAVALDKEAYHFSYDQFRLLQSIVQHSALALANARLREELEQRVITDYLTGLYTRSYFNRAVAASLSRDRCGVLLLIDIDDFKLINDTYGHSTGDRTLVAISDIIKRNIRKDDVACRWGGEELAVYMPSCELPSAKAVADRLVSAVKTLTSPSVTISCGLAGWRRDTPCGGLNDLFDRADKALYMAKKRGKNRVFLSE